MWKIPKKTLRLVGPSMNNEEYMDCPSCLVRIPKVLGFRATLADRMRATFDLHKIAHPVLKEHVFPSMKNDLRTQVLRKDYLAILYGNK